ncbi:MAG: tetratricopeptide repeat protein [Bacteroidota bacterium]
MFVLIAFSFVTMLAKANDPATEFQKANGLYQKQNYDSAAQIYESLVAQEYKSAEVYFNLANCYYKSDHISKAVLNYERALKIQPDDEDITFNLKVAQLRVVDKIETVPDIFYRRWIKSIATALTTDGWSRFVIGCIWIMFLFATVYILSPRIALRKTGFILSSFFLVISFCAWLLAQQSYVNHILQKSAIVTSVSAYVKSSPGDNNTDLFLLHEGTKMDILDEYENWVKIRIANGSIGWVRSSVLEEI